MTCPHCSAPLTAAHIRTLWAQFTNALRRTRSGGKVWRKHRAGYSRCRCAKCNERRKQK